MILFIKKEKKLMTLRQWTTVLINHELSVFNLLNRDAAIMVLGISADTVLLYQIILVKVNQ